jgi:tetratricopeptide (TPR) repeat protein
LAADSNDPGFSKHPPRSKSEQYLADGAKLTSQGRFDEALSAFRRSVEADPSNWLAAVNIEVVLGLAGKHIEAVDQLLETSRKWPQNAAIHRNLGVAFRHMGNFAAAEAALRQAVRLDSDSVENQVHLEHILRLQKRIEEAISHYTIATQLNPQFAQGWRSLSATYGDQLKLNDGIRCSEHLLTLRACRCRTRR